MPLTPGGRVQGHCCTKILTQGEFLAVNPSKTVAEQERTDCLSVALPGFTLLSLSAAPGHGRFSWQVHERPPPTDLVIVLQHFLI